MFVETPLELVKIIRLGPNNLQGRSAHCDTVNIVQNLGGWFWYSIILNFINFLPRPPVTRFHWFTTHYHPGGAMGKKKCPYGRRKQHFVPKYATGSFAKKLMKLSKINSSNNDPKNGDLKMVDLIKRAIYK